MTSLWFRDSWKNRRRAVHRRRARTNSLRVAARLREAHRSPESRAEDRRGLEPETEVATTGPRRGRPEGPTVVAGSPAHCLPKCPTRDGFRFPRSRSQSSPRRSARHRCSDERFSCHSPPAPSLRKKRTLRAPLESAGRNRRQPGADWRAEFHRRFSARNGFRPGCRAPGRSGQEPPSPAFARETWHGSCGETALQVRQSQAASVQNVGQP